MKTSIPGKIGLLAITALYLSNCTFLNSITNSPQPEREAVDMYRSVDMSYSFGTNYVTQLDPVDINLVFYNFSDQRVTFSPAAKYALLTKVEVNKELCSVLPDDLFETNEIIILGESPITIAPYSYYRCTVTTVPNAHFSTVPVTYTLVIRTSAYENGPPNLFYSTNTDYIQINRNPNVKYYY